MTPESAIFSRKGLLLRRDVYTSAPEYSAGDNIDITNNVISGRDWTDVIESAVANIPQPDLSDYYKKNETSSKEELSAAFDNCCTGCSEYSGGKNIDITDHLVSVTGRKTLQIKRPLTIDQDTSSFTIGIDDSNYTGNDANMSASFVVGEIDNSKVANYQISIYRPSVGTTGYNLHVENELHNSADFTLIPRKNEKGWLSYNSGHIEVVPAPDSDVHYTLYKKYDYNNSRNTSKQQAIYLSESAYNVRGWVSVMPENGGASIMPLSAGETDYATYTGSWDKVNNNINNVNLPRNSYTFIPFAFTADYPIVAIGIKGNGQVITGHAYVETIK